MNPRLFLVAALLGLLLPASQALALISFGAPGALNSTAAADSDDQANEDVDAQPDVASDGIATWVSVWSSDNSLGGTIGADSDILFARSADDGATWSSASALFSGAATDGVASDTEPRVAASTSGVWVAVFASTTNLAGGSGDLDVFFSRSTDNGGTWSNPARLNSDGASDGILDQDFQPSIATDGAGKWVAVWKLQALGGPTFNQTYYSVSTNNGFSWSSQLPLGSQQTANIGLGQGTDVVFNGSDFVAVWGSTDDVSGNGIDGDILYAIIDGGTLTAGAEGVLNSNGGTDSGADIYPSLAVDGTTVVATWQSNENLSGSGTDSDILVSRSTTGGSSWSAVTLLADNAISDIGADERPSVATDGEEFIVVWGSDDPLGKLTKTDGDILTVRSSDGGVSWTSVAPLASTAGKDKGADSLPAIAADGNSDTWAVVWESTDTLFNTLGVDEDILFSHAEQNCPSAPVAAATCFEPTQAGASSLTIKENGAKDSLGWKWNKGQDVDKAADLADPLTTADYVFCLYDETGETPTLIAELDVPAGGNCFSKPCWKETTTGYSYKHKYGSASGMSVFAGTGGKAKASVKAKTGFAAPSLPLDQDSQVSARLHNLSNSKCFAAEFSGNAANDAGLFKAKSD
ncbi:MAG TPA: sialidase family protein [Candidatus Limnocylindrales bacterium]|nr:sialidase family protein [Candidatus Limnocylindrales bacterium]